ncbi:uncharacterized protein LOC128759047 isoform X2 [Synchiropus splendidus]|uniref:uncharacterized protein LOC128759047 isoform X2 n=1 Tax=Synchiropus splendidus TaxID=270530 RepID=UPI00237E0D5F|nr:uncharacterized protein LOC128759047 isoform X2 [Synchiropus splendidus]
MSNKSTTKTPCLVQDCEEMDENIPHGFTIVQLEEVQQNMEKYGKSPVQSTPSCDGRSQNSRISGFHSALTPIVKFLNIGKPRHSNEPQRNANNGVQGMTLFSFGNSGAVAPKSVSSGSQASAKWYEIDPEIPLLELTCNSTMALSRIESPHSDHSPQTPVSARKMITEEQVVDVNLNNMSPNATLNVEGSCRLSPGEKQQLLELTQEFSHQHGLEKSGLSFEQTAAEGGADIPSQNSTEEMSSILTGSVTRDNSIADKSLMEKTEGNDEKRLEVTQDLFVDCGPENARRSLESDERLAASITASGHPANVTHDLNLPTDTSALHTASKSLSTDNGSVNNGTLELHVEIPESATVNLTHSIHEVADSDLNGKNQTFEIDVGDQAIPVNTTTELSCPQNVTMDVTTNHGAQTQDIETISLSNDTSGFAKNDCGACIQNGTMDILPPNVSSSSMNNEADSVTSTRSSLTKASDECEAKVTFESEELSQPSEEGKENVSPSKTSSTLVTDTQNITFESKTSIRNNTTVTIPEPEPCNKHQLTCDMASPQSCCNSSSSPKSNESNALKCTSQAEERASSVEKTSTVLPTESVAQDSPPMSATSSTDTTSAQSQKDPLQSSLSDSLGLHMTGTDKPSVFNLDDSLDLRSDYMVTSTPMVDSKTFSFVDKQEERKVAQKKLYGECPSRPAAHPASALASNIVCDRKTFLPQPTSKPTWPNSKTLTLPTKSKPTSVLPGRTESLMSRLPMTRPRTQVEVTSTPFTSEAVQEKCAGKSGPHIVRSAVTGPKLLNTGLLKPQASHIGSGIQRVGLHLRPLSARNNASSQGSDKLPSAAELSNRTEASVSSSDVTSRVKRLRQPLTVQRTLPAKTEDTRGQCEGFASRDSASRSKLQKQPSKVCANCVLLEQQLKIKCEELQRLKAELLK